MVKNLPSKAGEVGSIPSQGPKIPHAMGELSWSNPTRKPACCNEDLEQPNKYLKKKTSHCIKINT